MTDIGDKVQGIVQEFLKEHNDPKKIKTARAKELYQTVKTSLNGKKQIYKTGEIRTMVKQAMMGEKYNPRGNGYIKG